MRPVIIHQTVPLAPGVCVKCTNDHVNRKWFVDLGFDMEFIMMGQSIDGPIFLCDACLNDVFVQYSSQLPEFLENFKAVEEAELLDLRNKVESYEKEIRHLQGVNADNQKKIREVESKLITQTREEKYKADLAALDSLDASLMKKDPAAGLIFEKKEELDGTESNDSNASSSDYEFTKDAGTDDSSSDISDSGTSESSEESSDVSALLGSVRGR